MSLQRVCRICFKKDKKNLKNILLDVFIFCTGTTIGDNGPRMFCINCYDELHRYAVFKKKCTESELFWKTFEDQAKSKEDISTICASDIKTELNLKQPTSDTSHSGLLDDIISSSTIAYKLEETFSDGSIRMEEEEIDDTKINVREQKSHKNTETDNSAKVKRKVGRSRRNQRQVKISDKRKECSIKNVKIKTKIYKETECVIQSGIMESANNGVTERSDKDALKKHCGLCDFSSEYGDLKTHLNNHWHENDLICQLCDYTGRDFADMVTHRSNHYPNSSLFCFACDSTKPNLLLLQFHFREAHMNTLGGWCTQCDKRIRTWPTWRRHRMKHQREADDGLLMCDYCGRGYLYKYMLEEHIIDHMKKTLFVCEACGKGFRRTTSFKNHLKYVHGPNEAIKCEHCNKIYKNQHTYDIHMKEVSREKPYACDICTKTFSIPSSLRTHLFFHTGEKPYECDVCGFKYKTKSSLTSHKLKHLNDFKYECLKCKKRFTTSISLKRHDTIHTGLGKFKCKYCSKSYNAINRYKTHLKRHENAKDEA